ncbi:hypothetical protein [Spirosoma harenae]
MNTLKIKNLENKQSIVQRFICTFSRSSIRQFIDRNSEVFEGLARMSTPFGGSIRPTDRTIHTYQSNQIHSNYTNPINTMTTFEQRLVLLQNQLEQLHIEVSSLLAQTSITTQPAKALFRTKPSNSSLTSQKSPIGIQRFRQLQTID